MAKKSTDPKSAESKSDILKDITSKVEKDQKTVTTSINVSVPFERLAARKDAAFKSIAKNFKSDGFRPGKVPQSVLEREIPNVLVLERAGRDLISDLYLALLTKHKIDGIGEPQLQMTKLAEDNPFEFSITLANVPDMELGDYKKIMKSTGKTTIDPKVDDKELDDAIKTLQHQWAQQDSYQKQIAANPELAKTLDPRQVAVDDKDLPQVDDQFVQQLGEYESVADFKAKFRANIKTNKAMQELDKKRAELMGKIVDESTFSVPEIIYESELDRLFELRKAEIKQAGLKVAQYLKTLNQTEDQMRTSMRDVALNRVHTQMVIAEIAKAENLLPDSAQVKAEVEHLTKMYPDADQGNITAYVQSQLTTNLVLQYLVKPADEPKAESISKTKKPAAKKTDQKTADKKTGKKATPKKK